MELPAGRKGLSCLTRPSRYQPPRAWYQPAARTCTDADWCVALQYCSSGSCCSAHQFSVDTLYRVSTEQLYVDCIYVARIHVQLACHTRAHAAHVAPAMLIVKTSINSKLHSYEATALVVQDSPEHQKSTALCLSESLTLICGRLPAF